MSDSAVLLAEDIALFLNLLHLTLICSLCGVDNGSDLSPVPR